MISTARRKRIRPIGVALLRTMGIVMIGTLSLFGWAFGGQNETQRGVSQEVKSEWVPDVQKEWQRYGGKYFESVPADQPHATLLLKDSANRAGVGSFDIRVLIDGELVKDWIKSSPLRVSTGPHCIRVEMVAIPQRYQGTLGRYWPWLTAGSEDEMDLIGDSKVGFTVKYKRVRLSLNLQDLINPEEMKFSSDRPKDPEAAYTYCLKYVHDRR
jgi:hypothetical protein